MDYSKFLTYEDIKSRGYDLKVTGRLNQGDFETIEEAIDDFIREVVDGIYNLIASYRGNCWTRAFFEDMENITDDSHPNAIIMNETLKWAILTQAIFIYENGDKEALSKVDIERVGFSPKVIRRLWEGILR